MSKLIILVAGILLFIPISFAASNYDPSLNWKTLTTEHFYIHYHDDVELLAKQVAVLSEKIHTRVTNYFSWEPDDKTNLILVDRNDSSNGSATPIPDNRMIIHVFPPDEINGLENSENFLELLIVHEYTHIVHMDKALNGPYNLRFVIGRYPALFPNSLQPPWILEGLATYLESDIERGFGRARSSMFEMLMRTEYLDGFKPISMVNQPVQTWPAGRTRYLYGVYFFNFLADTYGSESIKSMINNQSDNLIPYMINHTSKKTFDKNLSQLWIEFEQYINNRFEQQIEKIKKRGIHAGFRVSNNGYFKKQVQTLPNGNILYFEDDRQSQSKLMLLRSDAKTAFKIDDVHDGRFDVFANKDLIISQFDIVRNVNFYRDLYYLDLSTFKKTRLSRGKRYTYATWSPDGSQIIAVRTNGGNSTLELITFNRKTLSIDIEPTVLWQGTENEIISHIDWSSDGEKLVASVWRPNTLWNLELFHIKNRFWEKLTDTANIEGQPRFTHDGKSIVFTADYESVFNIHLLNLESGKTSALTNLIGGGFYPSLSADNNFLYYSGNHESGSDIFKMELQREFFNIEFAHKKSTTPTPEIVKESEYKAPISAYSPLRSLFPKWWIPTVSIVNFNDEFKLLGIMTDGQDVLNRHQFNAQINYELVTDTVGGSIRYVYDRWDPAFAIQANRTPLKPTTGITIDAKTELIGRVRDDYSAQIILPIIRLDWKMDFHAALVHSTYTFTRLNPKVNLLETTDTLAGLAFTVDTTKKFPLSVSKSQGNRFRINLESSNLFSGDFDGNVILMDWRAYVSLGHQHVMAAHVAGAMSSGITKIFTLGGHIAEGPADISFNKREFSLRGYSSIIGRNMIVSALEWRLPIGRMERGIMAPIPIGLHQIYGNLFINAGNAWFEEQTPSRLYTSVGFEFNTEAVLFYNYLINFRFGVAKGIGSNSPSAVTYYSINSSF